MIHEAQEFRIGPANSVSMHITLLTVTVDVKCTYQVWAKEVIRWLLAYHQCCMHTKYRYLNTAWEGWKSNYRTTNSVFTVKPPSPLFLSLSLSLSLMHSHTHTQVTRMHTHRTVLDQWNTKELGHIKLYVRLGTATQFHWFLGLLI